MMSSATAKYVGEFKATKHSYGDDGIGTPIVGPVDQLVIDIQNELGYLDAAINELAEHARSYITEVFFHPVPEQTGDEAKYCGNMSPLQRRLEYALFETQRLRAKLNAVRDNIVV